MGVVSHNPLGPVANAVALHFAFSTPNFMTQEDMLADVPWRKMAAYRPHARTS